LGELSSAAPRLLRGPHRKLFCHGVRTSLLASAPYWLVEEVRYLHLREDEKAPEVRLLNHDLWTQAAEEEQD